MTGPHPSDSPDAVVDFWRAAGPDRWFRSDPAFDAQFRDRLLLAHEAAAGGALDAWAGTPQGALALVLLLDQFPRNAFRGTARMYATDARARQVADAALGAGHDQALEPPLARFFYLPFMHSEDPADQDRCVRLHEPLGDDGLRWALHHREVVRRFGRFPHRNAVLGRPSTPQEERFLAEGGFGA